MDFITALSQSGNKTLDISNGDRAEVYVSKKEAKYFAIFQRGEDRKAECIATSPNHGQLFLGWSLFKIFIATGVALIIDKLSLDPDRDNKYSGLDNAWKRTFTEVFNEKSRDLNINALHGDPSIIELVCHFKGPFDFNHILFAPDGTPLLSKIDFLNMISRYTEDTRREHESTGRCVYSNANYILLALLIEEVSHQQLHEFLNENIFKPFGMNRTYMRKEDLNADSVNQLAKPHIAFSDGRCQVISEGILNYLTDVVERAVIGGFTCAEDLGTFFDRVYQACDNKESMEPPLGQEFAKSLFNGVGTLATDGSQLHGYTKLGLRTTLDKNFAGMNSFNRLISSDTICSKETIGITAKGNSLEAFYMAGCGTGWAHTVYLIPTRRVYVIVLTNTTGIVDASDVISRPYVQQVCDLLPPALADTNDVNEWDEETITNKRGEYSVDLARRMKTENIPRIRRLETEDDIPDRLGAINIIAVGRYQNWKSGQILEVRRLNDANPDGRLGVIFEGCTTKKSSLMRFVRMDQSYMTCSYSGGTNILTVDRCGAWQNVKFAFTEQNRQIVSFMRHGAHQDDLFVRIG